MGIKMITILALAILFMLPLAIAPLIDNPNIPIVRPTTPTTITFNNNTGNVNNSQFLQGYTPFNLPYLTSESAFSSWLSEYNSKLVLNNQSNTFTATQIFNNIIMTGLLTNSIPSNWGYYNNGSCIFLGDLSKMP
jgi:hypothetical protein